MTRRRQEFSFRCKRDDYTRFVFVRLGHCLLIIALLGATGGHWAILQTIAWADMLAKNLRTETVAVAITKTFDGQNPCKMCLQISEGKKTEKKAELPLQVKKLEFITERPVLVFAAPMAFRLAPVCFSELEGVHHQPSVPPPRAAFV